MYHTFVAGTSDTAAACTMQLQVSFFDTNSNQEIRESSTCHSARILKALRQARLVRRCAYSSDFFLDLWSVSLARVANLVTITRNFVHKCHHATRNDKSLLFFVQLHSDTAARALTCARIILLRTPQTLLCKAHVHFCCPT